MKDSTRETIVNYVNFGLPPGGFITAVLSNDLFGAIGRADAENLRDLHEICLFVYNKIPSECWGSRQSVERWLARDWSLMGEPCDQ